MVKTKTPSPQSLNNLAFPLIRRVFPSLLAQNIVSIQPMTSPSGLIFYTQSPMGGVWTHVVFLPSRWHSKTRGTCFKANFYLQANNEERDWTKGEMIPSKTYHRFRVTEKTLCQDCGPVSRDRGSRENLDRDQILALIERGDGYLIPLPENCRDSEFVFRMCRDLGDSLPRGLMPDFAEMSLLVLEACGRTLRTVEDDSEVVA